ncbi:MAG TPA: ATP-binding protein, partial [Verrucomicrobiae bacterium]|nr:ATP-binding protein [Verrucomicrobiae bacterium]
SALDRVTPSELIHGLESGPVTNWPCFTFRQNSDLTFVAPGPPLERWTGLPGNQWETQPGLLRVCIPEADLSAFDRHLAESLKNSTGAVTVLRLRHQATGNLSFIAERRQGLGNGSQPDGYECTWLDLTGQQREQRRLRDLVWKDNLVHFTRGFGHEFNNILAGVMSLSDFFLTQIDSEHPFYEGLSLIRRQFQHGAALLARLTSVVQGKPGTCTVHDLNALTREAADLGRDIISRRIEIVLRLSESALPVYLDAFLFRQNVIGLALNAAEAIAGSGRLIFETAVFDQMPAVSHFHGHRPSGPCLCLTLRDDGRGIRPEVIASIFSPTYTTKPSNHGSGLGLPLAKAFAEQSGGGISVDSTPGVGSAFSFWWPQADFTEADRADLGEGQRKQAILVAGPRDAALLETVALLRNRGTSVVVSVSQTGQLLGANDERFDLLFVRAPERSDEWMEVLQIARRSKVVPFIVLQGPFGDVPAPELASLTSLILAWDQSPEEVANQLMDLLSMSDWK